MIGSVSESMQTVSMIANPTQIAGRPTTWLKNRVSRVAEIAMPPIPKAAAPSP